MRKWTLLLFSLVTLTTTAAPQFQTSAPKFNGSYVSNGKALCATASQTLAYLDKGVTYDPLVIHQGHVAPIPLEKIKATLHFICQHQTQMNDAAFIKQHFDFIRWYPDVKRAKQVAASKPLIQRLPYDRILMTKYFVHLASASSSPSPQKPHALFGLPKDETNLTIEQANANPTLIRFKYGKQAILKGALKAKAVPALAYLSRDDLESALLQGTVVADFGKKQTKKIFNVHRNNNIAYIPTKTPYQQERYWYFKQVDGIKGYGKDATHKITVNPEVTFAADITQLGLGKVLMVQYNDQTGAAISRLGILADTGGAFTNNLYQVDYLAGSYPGKTAFANATRHLPDYVSAYFLVLKDKH